MFITTTLTSAATRTRCGLTARRRLPAVLLTTAALLLAIAGSASAAPGLPITLNKANWSGNAGFGSVAPNAYFDPAGIVHLNGAVMQTTAASIHGSNPNFIGALPVSGDWPNRAVYTIVHTYAGTFADLAINSSGQIYLIPSSATGTRFVSLEGITYQPHNTNPVTPINLNTANWSGGVCCGATGAAAYLTDGNGADAVVHLQGAVTQTSSSGSNPDFIGTIPCLVLLGNGACLDSAPADRDVYEIVHTGDGTYADLAITNTDPAQIWLIPLSGTLTQSDTRFVSLEGISFPVLLFGGANPNPGWGAPCCGASGWIGVMEDPEGFIHLEGAVSQTLCCTPIATVPPWATPSRNLFFVVHTLGGTFADLSIDTNGVINVIPDTVYARPSDLRFLSFEGITYDAPSPKLFGLRADNTENQGATVTVTLRKPRALALLVQVERRRLVTVGVVHLGTHPAGRSSIQWNLRVKGQLLPAGRYEVSLHALNGKLLSVPATPGDLKVIVLATGHVSVQK